MVQSVCRVLLTGANGFLGQNVMLRLGELDMFEVTTFVRHDDPARLPSLIAEADAILHLAGENRPSDESAFSRVNIDLTRSICTAIRDVAAKTGRKVTLLLASSIQAAQDNPYGTSKRVAEEEVRALVKDAGNSAIIYRLPNVFGKWCKPNYNSVVATFCHNISRKIPIHVDKRDATLRLVYIDDVVSAFIKSLNTPPLGCSDGIIDPEYTITLGALADQLYAFENCRSTLVSERVGTGLTRALYATYISYLPIERFSYEVMQHGDQRGVFVEFLKTPDSGQFSFFTAYPGITRGGHYHHSKTEKFLVVKGEALFRFRHMLTDEVVQLHTSANKSVVVETIPGWSHDITNVGEGELLVMLWANENFDPEKPDTIASEV